MKPVAIVRHFRTEGPGYFAICLERLGLPWRLVCVDTGASIPPDPAAFAGIAFMGGPMSVNDRLPWIDEACALIRRAVASDVPVIGHCLGGQLMAKALGGHVTAAQAKEIGWGEVEVLPGAESERWFGPECRRFTAFHWHGEEFSVPPGATRLAASGLCPNQAFSLGRHFAMQCHVEMTAELVEAWCWSGAEEIAASSGPGVQSAAAMQSELDVRLGQLHALADRIYGRWTQGLARLSS
jgi:GMP synthase-like glutamine amidotransferase